METDESVVSVYEEELPFLATLKKLLEKDSKGSVTSVYETPYLEEISPSEQGVLMKRISNMPEFEEKPSAFTPSKIARDPSELEENKIVSNVADKTNEVSTDSVIIDEDFPLNFDYLNEIKPADEEKEEGDTAQTVANKVYENNSSETTTESVVDEVYQEPSEDNEILQLIEEEDPPAEFNPTDESDQPAATEESDTSPTITNTVNESNEGETTTESVVGEVYQEPSEDNEILQLIEEEDPPAESNPTDESDQISEADEIKAVPTVAGSVYEINTEDLANNSILIVSHPEASEDEGMFPIINEAAYLDVDFSSQSENTLFKLSRGKANLSVSAVSPLTVKCKVYSNEARYEGIYSDIDILYKAEKHFLKEDIIIHKYNGKSDFHFQMDIENADYQMMNDGTILFSDPDSKSPLFYMAKPFAVDSKGDRCDAVYLEIKKDGSLKLLVDQEWLKNAAYPVTIDPTIWLCDAAFSRNSVAYKQDGSSVATNSPRYETGKYSTAIMLEEGTTNTLTSNQSSIESSLPAGYVGDGGTATRSTATYRSGAACMKIDANTSDPWGGADLWNNATGTAFSVTPGVTYTVSFYAKGVAGGENILIRPYKTDWTPAANGIGATLTSNSWTRLTNTFTVPAGCSSIFFILRKNNVTSAISWYVDCLQFEQKPYGTSWMSGGSTRAAESLTVNTNGIFNKGNWAVDMWYIPKLVQSTTQQILWYTNIDGNNRYRIWVDSSSRINGGVGSTGTYYDITSPTSIALGSQNFITLTGDGTTLRLMVNGSEVGNRSYVEPVGLLPTNMYLGSDQNTARQANGLIDDTRISNRARTLAEHQSAYNSSGLAIDAVTTCRMSFNSDLKAYASSADDSLGIESYWNYVTRSLGGGWTASVNTLNLNLVLSKTLFSIPGRGIPISESITYNSTDRRVGPLGKCWRLGSSVNLTEYYDPEYLYPPHNYKTVIYNSGDGSSHVFTPDGTGGYDHPPGIYLTLQKNAQGIYTITDKDLNVYTFDDKNRLSTIKDQNDNTTTFIYGTVNGRLYQIADASDRRFTYDYNSKGQLRTITDPDERFYQMNYQNDYLTSITDPENNTYNFSYTDPLGNDNQCMYSFTDPLNQVTKFINYGSSGKILYFRDARTVGQAVYDTSFFQSAGENGEMITTVTDPGNHIDNYYHDGNTGNLIEHIDGSGHSFEYSWSSNNLTGYTDAKGDYTYHYDSNGNMDYKIIEVDNEPSHDIYLDMPHDDRNHLERITDNEGRTISYSYSDKGELLSTQNPDVKESKGKKYDAYGNIIEYNQAVSSSYNLLLNGGFEELSYNWEHFNGSADISFNEYIHGNL